MTDSKSTEDFGGRRLPKSFYIQEDVVMQSKELLGKYLVSRIGGELTAGRIVETEAYRGRDDKACHAYNQRRTKRTEIMFAEGGLAYVYLIYGIHHLFNVVTGPPDTANAILIRGLEPVTGIPLMLKRRKMEVIKRRLTAGPGALSQALGITTDKTGHSLVHPESKIWLEDHDERVAANQIICSPRVGIDYAEECAAWEWRFRLKGSNWVSPAK